MATLNDVDGGSQDNSKSTGSSTSDVDGISFTPWSGYGYDSNPLIQGYHDTRSIEEKSRVSNHADLNGGTVSQIWGSGEVYYFSSEDNMT